MNALPLPAIAEDIWDMKYRLKDNETFLRRASGDTYKTLEPRFLESKEGLMPSSSG